MPRVYGVGGVAVVSRLDRVAPVPDDSWHCYRGYLLKGGGQLCTLRMVKR